MSSTEPNPTTVSNTERMNDLARIRALRKSMNPSQLFAFDGHVKDFRRSARKAKQKQKPYVPAYELALAKQLLEGRSLARAGSDPSGWASGATDAARERKRIQSRRRRERIKKARQRQRRQEEAQRARRSSFSGQWLPGDQGEERRA